MLVYSINSSAIASSLAETLRPKCLGRFEVDHQFELRRLLDGQIGRLCPIENSPGVDAELPKGVNIVSTITDEAPRRCVRTPVIDRGDRMACRQRDELIGPVNEKCVVGNDQGAVLVLGECSEGGINITFRAGIQDVNRLPESACCHLHISQLGVRFRAIGVDQNGNRRRRRHQLSRKLQPLSRHFGRQQVQPRDIPARPVKARDKAEFDGVVSGEADYRNCRGSRLGGEARGCAGCRDHGHTTLHQIGRQRR